MRSSTPKLVVADEKAKIFSIDFLAAAGMKAGHLFPIRVKDLIRLPHGSELFTLPDRSPIGYDSDIKGFTALPEDPSSKKTRKYFAVAAFCSPGYTITHNSAYIQEKQAMRLPLFSYSAVAFYKNDFYVTATRVDKELRQDTRFMDMQKAASNIRNLKKIFPENRLFRHLEGCALCYSCPAAKNLFLNRYEAPLPTSVTCNSRCLGCISYQPDSGCPITQPRIKFRPSVKEIAEVALYHIKSVKDPVVSFGQGCEGEPLLMALTIEKAIKRIREVTKKGIINLNTNASKPKALKRLLDAGLDSIRVSSNSVQEIYYNRYYRPRGYSFKDVLESIRISKKKGAFVSLNYFMFPGFSDSKKEVDLLKKTISKEKIDMLQLRNLNIDPMYYLQSMKFSEKAPEQIGIKESIAAIKKEFPKIMLGYFNPSKARICRWHK